MAASAFNLGGGKLKLAASYRLGILTDSSGATSDQKTDYGNTKTLTDNYRLVTVVSFDETDGFSMHITFSGTGETLVDDLMVCRRNWSSHNATTRTSAYVNVKSGATITCDGLSGGYIFCYK